MLFASSFLKPRCLRRAAVTLAIISLLLVLMNIFNSETLRNSKQQEIKKVHVLAENSSVENPGDHLHFLRFDVMVKLVYAYYYSVYGFVPEVFVHAYTEHLGVWNQFYETCDNVQPHWFDVNAPCRNKTSSIDFISSFKNTIDNIRKMASSRTLVRYRSAQTVLF